MAGCLSLAAGILPPLPLQAAEPGRLEVAVQSGTLPPQHLVRHEDDWRFFKGTLAPQANWRTAEDTALDAAWAGGPGGFGYGDPGIVDQATALPDMRNGYTTLFIRQAFEIDESPQATSILELRMDYDDGFVAYLDGAELHRENAPGAAGEPVPHSETANGLHEASCCTAPTNAPRTFDLGPVGTRLAPGRHLLAIQGLNESPGSSDFHLIADLFAAPETDVTVGRYLAISRVPTMTLTGTNNAAEVTAILVNGEAAVFDPGSGDWSHTVALAEGMNRVRLEGRNGSGLLVANARMDVVRVGGLVEVGGPVPGKVTWSPAQGVLHVGSNVTVPAGAQLTIAAGTVVLFDAAGGISSSGGTVRIEGSPEAPVYLLPADGTSPWAGVRVSGAGGELTIRHAEMVAGFAEIESTATGIIEDSVLRDLANGDPIIHSEHAASVAVRRCHLARFHETLFQYTLTLLEDCVLEDLPDASSDGIDFDGAPVGSAIRRCTIRRARETNSDAIDIGSGSNGVLIEGCWLYDLTDKGVSIGEESYGIIVRDCLIHDTGIGVEVKDGCTSEVSQTTIADCDMGFRLRIKTGSEGGHLTNSFDNILWGNTDTLVLLDDSTIVAHHSLLQGGPVSGVGNVDEDPQFLNPGAMNYRLPPTSPLRFAGVDGGLLGAPLPVGAAAAPTQNALNVVENGPGEVAVRFATDPERRYVLESAVTVDGVWHPVEVFLPFAGERLVGAKMPVGSGPVFFRLFSELRE